MQRTTLHRLWWLLLSARNDAVFDKRDRLKRFHALRDKAGRIREAAEARGYSLPSEWRESQRVLAAMECLDAEDEAQRRGEQAIDREMQALNERVQAIEG